MELAYQRRNVWAEANDHKKQEIMAVGADFKQFVDAAKTERLAVTEIVRQAEAAGFKNLAAKCSLVVGDKIYVVNRKKAVILAVIGQAPFNTGFGIVATHIDSPRLDLKIMPLYERSGLALFKTQYYGGIKPYQWVARSFGLYGTVVKKDGKTVDIALGSGADDPVLYISDLAPHLSALQMTKPLAEGVNGEMLNLVAGSIPGPKGVKAAILNLLWQQYGICEEDFCSAELQAVPAEKARDAGFDRSMVVGYGFDDRAGAYASLRALLEVVRPRRTAVAVFYDREEVGFKGNTGSDSPFLVDTLEQLCSLGGEKDLKQCIRRSQAISLETGGGNDPSFPETHDAASGAQLGCGIYLVKHFGGKGQVEGNLANAEYIGKVRAAFYQGEVIWQAFAVPVDAGAGRTVGLSLGMTGMEVMDIVIPNFSAHAPLELISKADLYMGYLGCKAFWAHMG